MATVSRFETLTNRHVAMQERTKRLVSDLRRLVRLLEHDINYEEQRTGISDLANSNYSVAARQFRTRRDNLAATISELEKNAGTTYH
jgi:flagellar FliJ protein